MDLQPSDYDELKQSATAQALAASAFRSYVSISLALFSPLKMGTSSVQLLAFGRFRALDWAEPVQRLLCRTPIGSRD
jgi:hypothetical protein